MTMRRPSLFFVGFIAFLLLIPDLYLRAVA